MELIKSAKELLIREPFYGFFLLNLCKEIVDNKHSVKTAAVGTNGINFTLYVNKSFWDTLNNSEQIACLIHELMHICFFHLTDNFKCDNKHNMNIAMDCEINQNITGLPKGCVTLADLSDILGKSLKACAGSWYYYNEIQNFAKNNPDKCKENGELNNFTEIDDHSMWPTDASEAECKLYENQIKSKLKETTETITRQAGRIPMELIEILKKIQNMPPIFNWRNYFKRVIGNTITSDIQLTRLRPSKRIPESRGIKLKRKPDICVIIDTSGSINMKNFEEFFSEITHIHKTGVNITIVECDTKITQIFKFSKNQKIEFKGRGGTDMSDGLEYYNKHKEFSSCVLFTDGWLSTFKLPYCKNLIWIITNNGNKSQKYPGQTIFIP